MYEWGEGRKDDWMEGGMDGGREEGCMDEWRDGGREGGMYEWGKIMHGWMCWEETYVGRTGMSDDFRVGGADVGELSLLRGPPAVRVVAAPPRAKRGLCSTNARGHACVVPLLHAATCVSHLSSPHAMARSHLVSRSLELSLSPTASASCSFAFAWGAPALPLRCLDRGGRRCGQAIATPPPPAGVSARRSSLHHGPHQAQRAMLRPLRQLRRLPQCLPTLQSRPRRSGRARCTAGPGRACTASPVCAPESRAQ